MGIDTGIRSDNFQSLIFYVFIPVLVDDSVDRFRCSDFFAIHPGTDHAVAGYEVIVKAIRNVFPILT